MSCNELVEILRGYVGQRVRIRSSVVCQRDWTLLVDVTVRDGNVWCHAENGISWLVTEEGLEIDAEPLCGSWDHRSGREQMKAIYDARVLCGPSLENVRERCPCKACTEKHVQNDLALAEAIRRELLDYPPVEVEEVEEIPLDDKPREIFEDF